MGNSCIACTPEGKTNRLLGNVLRRAERHDRSILKILLLGTGESGKSTIFKQARSLFGHEYTQHELSPYKSKVFFNIVGQMKSVIEFRRTMRIPLENEDLERHEDVIRTVKNRSRLNILSPETIEAIRLLWADQGIQQVWLRRGEFQVFDCLEYFLSEDNFNRIINQGSKYIPNFQDALQCRDKTTGIITEKLKMDETDFDLFDVGGQRPERKKWINCFDHVTTIIFVTAINEYDQTLYEEADINRVAEALEVWEDIVNKPTFRHIGFVMFLNKWDIFKEKVCKIPFKVVGERHEDYTGPDPMDFEDGSREQEEAILACFLHMENMFVSKVDKKRSGIIESFQTVATDNTNMDKVFANCKHQLLHMALNAGGFHNPETLI